MLRTATLSAEDGQGFCAAFGKSLARRAEMHGARFVLSSAASALVTENGRAVGVSTVDGTIVRADAVVVCTGAGSAPLMLTAGVYVPVQPLRGYSATCAIRKDATAEPPRTSVCCKPYQLYITRIGEQVRFTCYGEFAPALDDSSRPPTAALRARLVALVEHAVPDVAAFCDWHGATHWHGSRALTPDCQPVVGATRVPGLFVNTGHSFNGWRDAQLTAQHLACKLQGSESPADYFHDNYSMSRFQLVPR